ncbi:hypothetical protein CY0110_17562 [Crocosphaera chwakensis CCY0110]|uniref:Uncharacterized protein n=1 Tax=Crocosphaera chwakensis CCY0110 TaxID=391612 RepID=A3IIJ4_9CHRO|nr:hypothetical protein CY0110_17562 [Crocosphaera chwakensis CCY0110]
MSGFTLLIIVTLSCKETSLSVSLVI